MTQSISAGYGPATTDRIRRNLPLDLVLSLTGPQLARVEQLVNSTYLDGYAAAGGDTHDTVSHRDEYRQRLCRRAAEAVDQVWDAARTGQQAHRALLA